MSTRTRLLAHTALLLAGVGLCPLAAQARDSFAAAQAALKAGDPRTAAIELRNVVRDDPQNAAARYDLAQVELQLADPAAAERDVRAAEQRGYDVHKTVPLLGAALLAQNRAADLLTQLQPRGKDKALDADILVLRGEAQARLGKIDAAKASLHDAEALDPMALQPWLADAKLAIGLGDHATASERVDHALSLQPKSLDALLLKATLLRQQGDAAGAKAMLDQVIADQPPALAARVERASLLIAQGKYPDAKPDLDIVLKLTPANVQAMFLRAVVLHEQHDDKAAQALLQRLDPIFASYPRAYLLRAAVQEQLGELKQAQESAGKYIARQPADLAGYKLLAQLYAKDHRPDQAIVPLKQAVEAGKADAAIYDMLGRAYAATGEPVAAAAAFAKAAELAPGNVGVETMLAGALLGSGQPEKSLDVLEKVLAKDPGNAGVQEAAVGAALATGDVAKAESVLAKVKQTAGETPTTQNLAAALQLARLDGPGAEAILDKLVKTHPDNVPARINLARAYIMQGQGVKAEALLTSVLDKTPTAEPALTLLVNERVRTNRLPDAVTLLERAHQAAPADLGVTTRLGKLYIDAGTPQKALDLAQAVQQAAGGGAGATNEQMLLLAANAQLALKQPDRARATLTKLVAVAPRAIDARRQLAGVEVQAADYEAARNLIKEGMRAAPRVYQLYLDYALIDLKASGLPAALTTADQLRKDDLGFAELTALKGDLYMAAGKPDDAAKAYAAAASATPSSGIIQRLAGAYVRAGKPDEARAALASWVGKHPDDLAGIATESELDLAAGKLDDAEAEMKAVLAKQPRSPIVLNNLAWLYQLRGNPQARPMAEEAYLLAPSSQSADTLGWILTRGGDPSRGLVLLRQAASAGDPRIAYHLGVALNDVGQKDDAVKVLNAVVAVKGDFAEKTDAEKLLGQITKGS